MVMSRIIRDKRYYSFIEVCRTAGISRSTLLRWMKVGTVIDEFQRDRRGWRVFSDTDLILIQQEAQKMQ
jgi:DNA-binding transcriptional MerR regulator